MRTLWLVYKVVYVEDIFLLLFSFRMYLEEQLNVTDKNNILYVLKRCSWRIWVDFLVDFSVTVPWTKTE